MVTDLSYQDFWQEFNRLKDEIFSRATSLIEGLFKSDKYDLSKSEWKPLYESDKELIEGHPVLSLTENWRTHLQALYQAIIANTSWKTDYAVDVATIPEFNVYVLVGEDIYIPLSVIPVIKSSKLYSSKTLELFKRKKEIGDKQRKIEEEIDKLVLFPRENPNSEKYIELTKQLNALDKNFRDIEEKLIKRK